VSRVNGRREEFLDVLGVLFYRCHRCEARYARLGGRIFSYSYGKNTKERTHVVVLTSVSIGLVLCAVIALFIQRLAHRWPF